ncbi:hypothetical protein IWW38_004443, partial [Coemansia aciculifera]
MFGGSSGEGGTHHRQPQHSSSNAVTLSTDRIALGFLRALTSILRSHSGSSATQEYASVILPLVLFCLRSERHRIRRQALLLLRVLSSHESALRLLLDELGPSIVCDIPPIAADAAARLTGAVAKAFKAHSEAAILECVRQVQVQGAFAVRVAALLEIVRVWVANVELHPKANGELLLLEPVVLSRGSLVVLRCLLYLTAKTAGVEDLWMELVRGECESNLWLVIRYLTNLLLHTQSLALLGLMRRIVVFLTRSATQGHHLVCCLVDEARRPAAAIPIVETDGSIMAMHGGSNEKEEEEEAWWAAATAEFDVFMPRRRDRRLLVSTAALAVFYLAAVSYEQPAVVAGHGDLAVLPPAVFALANPERWVRDAARTLLVNLVAAERVFFSNGSGGGGLAEDAAHVVLSVLRGDECAATGFGNVSGKDDDGDEMRRKPGKSPDDYALNHAWSPMATATTDIAAPVPAPTAAAVDGDEEDDNGSDHQHAINEVDSSTLPPPPTSQPPVFSRRSLSIDYYSDTGGNTASSNSNLATLSGPGRQRAILQRFMVHLSRLFSRRRPGCAQEWAGVAVRWAMSCPVRPLAALALQVFSVLTAEAQYGGTLVITPTRSMILHLIDRLSNVVGDPSEDLAAFAETVLAALKQTAVLAAR